MKAITHFVPGGLDEDEGFAARLRWPIPASVTSAYVEAYTEAGEAVLVPYCQGTAEIRSILALGRRPLALHFDPTVVAVVRAQLAPPPTHELNSAVARLGDSLKQGLPLRRYLEGLYASTCPACLRPVVADYFVWDRDQDAPVAKYVRCPACDWDGQAAIEPEDEAKRATALAGGMHYHYILDRIAPRPQDDALRRRLELLLKLYTPRNFYALAELTLKIESLFPEGPLRRALKVPLLDCLDRCSSLAALPDRRAGRRGLTRPGRFLERNVWRAFEETITGLEAPEITPAAGLADSLEIFQSSDAGCAGFIGQMIVRDLARHLAPQSMRLVLVSPPPLDPSVWSLAYLWGAWLLGAEAVAALRPLLHQRTPDPEWYARVMAGSLRVLAGLLRDGPPGHLLLVLTEQHPAVLEALVLAASSARLGVASLVHCGTDYRLELVPTPTSAPSASPAPLETQIEQAATQAAVDAIRARGEPVPWHTLHAAIQWRLAETGLLVKAQERTGARASVLDLVETQVQVGLDHPRLVRVTATEADQRFWWLADPAKMASPLCDRVEASAYEVLQKAHALTEHDFSQQVYAQFPGVLTPEPALVAACLRSLASEVSPDRWALRDQDLPEVRQAERQEIVEQLLLLGQRLGHRSAAWDVYDVAWFDGEEARSAFVVCWQATLGEALALASRLGSTTPYLVIPGGRAALLSYKLAHNPLWQRTVEEAGWHFIKYRHVRQLAEQPEVDEYALRAVVGLDPIAEKEPTQLPLF